MINLQTAKKFLSKYWLDCLVLFAALFVGFVLAWVFKPKELVIEPTLEISRLAKLNADTKSENDSLKNNIRLRDIKESEDKRRQFISDSSFIVNHKDLKKDYEKLSLLDDSTRDVYVRNRLIAKHIR